MVGTVDKVQSRGSWADNSKTDQRNNEIQGPCSNEVLGPDIWNAGAPAATVAANYMQKGSGTKRNARGSIKQREPRSSWRTNRIDN